MSLWLKHFICLLLPFLISNINKLFSRWRRTCRIQAAGLEVAACVDTTTGSGAESLWGGRAAFPQQREHSDVLPCSTVCSQTQGRFSLPEEAATVWLPWRSECADVIHTWSDLQTSLTLLQTWDYLWEDCWMLHVNSESNTNSKIEHLYNNNKCNIKHPGYYSVFIFGDTVWQTLCI